MTRLRFAGVSRRFGRHEVLRGIDLELRAGQRMVLLGPNGAGKTTLLRMGAGLLRPTTGTVTADGHPSTHPRGRSGLGFVCQDAPTYAELTVSEHLQWWGRVHGKHVKASTWVEAAGLQRMAHEKASALSRGQRQRLSIAMAFSIEPTLLLLDEPTTALDGDGRRWLEALLHESAAAILMATHDPGWADAFGAHTLALEAGRLVGGAQ